MPTEGKSIRAKSAERYQVQQLGDTAEAVCLIHMPPPGLRAAVLHPPHPTKQSAPSRRLASPLPRHRHREREDCRTIEHNTRGKIDKKNGRQGTHPRLPARPLDIYTRHRRLLRHPFALCAREQKHARRVRSRLPPSRPSRQTNDKPEVLGREVDHFRCFPAATACSAAALLPSATTPSAGLTRPSSS